MPTIHPTINIDRIINAVSADEYLGFCIYCGTEQSGVEPDARRYKCESCGTMNVYGAEDILLNLSEID